MEEQNNIAIFGGAFNPPLNSHFSIAQQVLNQYEGIEKVIFVPVNSKYEKQGLIENKHRYQMLKLVTDKNPKFEVSDIDMHKNRSLYTIEVLEQMQKQFPKKQLWFLMGSDNLKELFTWNRAEELISNYKILVMERDDDKIENIIEQNPLLKAHQQNIEKLEQSIRSNYRSSFIREQIKNNKSVRYLLPDEVYEYIIENKLYK